MALLLKNYQSVCLAKLGEYFALAGKLGAGAAFERMTRRTYLTIEQFPGMPYVCLRIPTGGGKTILAAHAVGGWRHRRC